MGKSAEEYLAEQLAARDERIIKLTEEIEELKERLRGRTGEFLLPIVVKDDGLLPVPRIEFVWETRVERDEWAEVEIISRIVHRTFDGTLIGRPIGSTSCRGVTARTPLGPDGKPDLPIRDSNEAVQMAAQFGLPVYAIGVTRPVRIGNGPEWDSVIARGLRHRRIVG